MNTENISGLSSRQKDNEGWIKFPDPSYSHGKKRLWRQFKVHTLLCLKTIVENSTQAVSANPYDIYLASGFPFATRIENITQWTSDGDYIGIVHYYSTSTGYLLQNLIYHSLKGTRALSNSL